MSHFTKVKTKLYNLATLKKSLSDLKLEWTSQNQEIVGYQNQKQKVELSIKQHNNYDIGFQWNGKEYELVADLETWNQNISVERFIDKVTQQYARMTIHNQVKELGFQVDEEWEMDDNSIELTVSRWV